MEDNKVIMEWVELQKHLGFGELHSVEVNDDDDV